SPEPVDVLDCGPDRPRLVRSDPVAGSTARSGRPTHPILLSAADADAPTGRPAQRARTRPALRTCHYLRVRLCDDDETGHGARLEQLLGRPAGRGTGGLHSFPRRRLCERGDRLFGRELCRRPADEPGIARPSNGEHQTLVTAECSRELTAAARESNAAVVEQVLDAERNVEGRLKAAAQFQGGLP